MNKKSWTKLAVFLSRWGGAAGGSSTPVKIKVSQVDADGFISEQGPLQTQATGSDLKGTQPPTQTPHSRIGSQGNPTPTPPSPHHSHSCAPRAGQTWWPGATGEVTLTKNLEG